MLGWLFGKKNKKTEPYVPTEADKAAEAAENAFGEAKQAALERVLGPMDDMVYHAIIPFFIGGGLDLYTFSKCIPGTVFATQELLTADTENRPKAGRTGYFELVACLPPGKGRDDEEGVRLINRILNPIARYASMASLNPNETAEAPGDSKKSRSQPVLFDVFNPSGAKFVVNGEEFHLLLVMTIHHSELAYARQNGTHELIKKLQSANVYPYSDPKRKPVV